MAEAAVLNAQGYPETWDFALNSIQGIKSTTSRGTRSPAKKVDKVDFDKSALEWRREVAALLREAGLFKEADKFERCGQEALVLSCVRCGHTKIVPVGCDLRVCPVCQHAFSVKIAFQIRDVWRHVQQRRGWSLKHITLTVKTDGDLLYAYDRGWRAVAKLWRKHLKRDGAGMVVAAEFGAEKGNVHYHLLYFGPFVPQADLSDWWLELTGDSQVVYIQMVRDRGKGFDASFLEVLKYPAKFYDLLPAKAVEVFLIMRGTRRVRTYGIFYGRVRTKILSVGCSECFNDTWAIIDRGPTDEMKRKYAAWLEVRAGPGLSGVR